MRVILIGFMGAGKTTVGKRLSTLLHHRFIDLDHFLEAETGRKIKDVFAKEGEEGFRVIETAMLTKVLESETDIVLATGGGIVTREENLSLLKEEKYIIYLKAGLESLIDRLKNDVNRPLLQGTDREVKLKQLLESRLHKYEGLAKYRIETDGKDVDEIVEECKNFL